MADSNATRTGQDFTRREDEQLEHDARDEAAQQEADAMWSCLQRDPAPYATEAGHFADFHLTEAQTADIIGAVAKMRLKDGLQSMYAQSIVNTITKVVEKMVDDFAFAEALTHDAGDFDARR